MNDSLHSLFLAQSIGLFLFIVAIIMLSRASYYQQQLSQIKAGSTTITLAATFGLIMSIALVLVHNIWIWDSEIMITIIAWFLLVKSILWLSLPESMVEWSHKLYSGWGYYCVAAIAGIVGVLLITHGFYLFHVSAVGL